VAHGGADRRRSVTSVPVQTFRTDALSELLPPEVLDAAVRQAIEEDRRTGDLTSESAIPAGTLAGARLVAKQAGVLAGLPVFQRCFELCDPTASFSAEAQDGDRVAPGDQLATVRGDARALLLAERTALNFMQRMSGIATLTARFVQLAAGKARILDTRKTTPGLRAFEKYAVRCGGGENHRFGLFDQVMIKENHVALAGSDVESVTRKVRSAVGAEVFMTVEARDPEEAAAAVRGGADVVLLDNMTPGELRVLTPTLRQLADSLGQAVQLEASGGIDEHTVVEFAACGIDRVSVGALTHSAPALDLSLYLESDS
jgi:nicotinate-nucleotide pyrophosphorylase (carboxylating)